MSSEALVSIIVPVFNGERYVEKCVDRLLAQEYTHLEVLVLDDASTDRTAGILDSFADPRLRYVRNEENLGWLLNVKKGYELCTGEFVTMCPVDDFLAERFVADAIQVFTCHPTVGIWACGAEIVDEEEELLYERRRRVTGLIPAREFFRQTYAMADVSPPSESMVRKRCLDEVDAPECYAGEYQQYPETNLYLKIARRGYDAFHSESLLTKRTFRTNSLTGMFEKRAFVMKDVYRILRVYRDDDYGDEEMVLEGNRVARDRIADLVVYNLAHLRVFEVCRTLRLFFGNDSQLNSGGLSRRVGSTMGMVGRVARTAAAKVAKKLARERRRRLGNVSS